jgi:hypothetical protein
MFKQMEIYGFVLQASSANSGDINRIASVSAISVSFHLFIYLSIYKYNIT